MPIKISSVPVTRGLVVVGLLFACGGAQPAIGSSGRGSSSSIGSTGSGSDARDGTLPTPATLLLTPADVPPGYVSDDALENADATARNDGDAPLVAASAFAGYRGARQAVVDYVALLHRRQDLPAFVAAETAAVAHSHDAARITLSRTYGDAAMLAYQEHGSRGEEWAVVVFGDGPYASVVGAYDAAGEQASITLLQGMAVLADRRLRAAPLPAPSTPAAPTRPSRGTTTASPAPRIVSLVTTTGRGRPSDVFRPHGAVYWRALWHIGAVGPNAREMLADTVTARGSATVLYRNGIRDQPFAGDNTATDHLRLNSAAPGSYTVTFTITIGHTTARATHAFRVVPTSQRGA